MSIIRIVLYLLCTLLLGGRVLRSKRFHPSQSPRFWVYCLGTMAALTVIMAFDAHHAAVTFFRSRSRAAGWYAHRHAIQGAALICVGIAALFAVRLLLKRRHALDLDRTLAAVEVALLCMLMALRTISYHPMDRLLTAPIVRPITIGILLEGTLLMAVIVQQMVRLSRRPRQTEPSSFF